MLRPSRRWERFLLIFICIADCSGVPQMKPYQFAYEVKDSASGNDFGHSESSDGQVVEGQYHVVLPNGQRQTVSFTADAINGYQADVVGNPPTYEVAGVDDDHISDYTIQDNEFRFLSPSELRNLVGLPRNSKKQGISCPGKIYNQWIKCSERCCDANCELEEVKTLLEKCVTSTGKKSQKQACINDEPCKTTIKPSTELPSTPLPPIIDPTNCQQCGIVNTGSPKQASADEAPDGEAPEGEAPAPGGSRRFRQEDPAPDPAATGAEETGASEIGKPVDPPRKYPWQVAIVLEVKPTFVMCGGVILNNRWIVTSRGCKRSSGLAVRIGAHELSNNDTVDPLNTKNYKIKKFVKEPTGEEIALIEVEEDIPFNDVIRPVCLPIDDSENYAGYRAIVSGWGRIDLTKDKYPTALVEAGVFINSQSKCGKENELRICAHPKDDTKDSCAGDLGGPLMVQDGGKFTLIGIVDEGPQLCLKDPKSPKFDPSTLTSFYIRISKFMGWIEKTISNGKCS